MVNAEGRYKGRVALITGGARGIGFASAARIAQEGGVVALADIDGEAVRNAARKIPGAIAIACDITRANDVQQMVAKAEEALGPLDVFINSAAVLDDKTFLESSVADWDRMLSICLHGPMRALHIVLPGMVERSYGRVVCLASDAARIGQARLSYYAAAKAAVIALSKSIAQEVGGNGVTLNIVSPGATNTPLRMKREEKMRLEMGEEKYARRVQAVLKMYPTGRLGEPEDTAAAITFLCSEEAAWITGQVLSVNGGFSMP